MIGCDFVLFLLLSLSLNVLSLLSLLLDVRSIRTLFYQSLRKIDFHLLLLTFTAAAYEVLDCNALHSRSSSRIDETCDTTSELRNFDSSLLVSLSTTLSTWVSYSVLDQ